MNDFIVHYFFIPYNAEDNLHTRQFTITESFFSFWRFGLGFIFHQKRPSHYGGGILLLPNGFDEEDEIEHSFDLHVGIFPGTFTERSFIERRSERNRPVDGLQKTGRKTFGKIGNGVLF